MKDKKMLLGIGIAFLFLATVSFTYAYFTATLVNKDVKDQIVTAGTLELTYTDGPEIVMNNIKPGATITKEVSVKNTGTLNAAYNLVWQELANKIINDEMLIEATCTRYNGNTVEGTCESLSSTPIKRAKIKENVSIEPNITHKYNITITFKEANVDQNYNQGKSFTGTLGINEYVENTPIYCTFDGEMVQGAEYVNGQYTYKYKQEASGRTSWSNISFDGWGVQLTDGESTDAVTTKLCTYINDKPIVSMASMFHTSNPVSIDLSSFNTSNVKDMSLMFASNSTKNLDLSNFDTSKVIYFDAMFYKSQATNLDLSSFDTGNAVSFFDMFEGSNSYSIIGLENFNTANVDDMGWMFKNSKVKELNLSNFDTSKITDMTYMFSNISLNELDLSSFNTSKVTDMSHAFEGSSIKKFIGLENFVTNEVTNMAMMFYQLHSDELDLSSFNTHNVTDMGLMFTGIKTNEIIFSNLFDLGKESSMYDMFFSSNIEKLDLSSFNTSNITDMYQMFWNAKIGELNLNGFDTSNVTNMAKMFSGAEIKKIDLSSFDTSSVTNMSNMFEICSVEQINGLEKFNTKNVTNMSYMFYNSNVASLDLSSFDTNNVTNMSYMFANDSNLETIYVSDKFVTTNVTSFTNMFYNSPKLVGGVGTKYNSSILDKTYARIDADGTPGYFTKK